MKLQNDHLRIEVDRLGARLTSIFDVQHEIEYLWSGEEKYWKRQAPVLFPIIGSLIDDTYIHEKKKYKLSKHGFLRDRMMDVSYYKKNKVAYRYHNYKSINPSYPFDCTVDVAYELINNSVVCTFIIENEGREPLYYSIGGHPGFNIEEKASVSLIPKDDKVLRYLFEGSLMSGQEDVDKLVIDVQPELFVNDALVYRGLESVIVQSGKRKIQVDVSEFLVTGLWTPYNEKDRSIAPFICVEPWQGLPDVKGHNQLLKEKQDIQTLEPFTRDEISFRMTFDYGDSI